MFAGRTWPGKADDSTQSALQAIREHLGMEVAFVSEFVGGQRVFRQVDAAGDDPPIRAGGADPLEDSYCQRVVDGRLPELIHDASTLPAARELPVTTALPVGAHLSVPIRLSDGRVYGTYCCFSSTPDHSLTQRDLAMMRVFADLTAEQVERELQRTRERQEALARVTGAVAGDGLSLAYQPIVDLERHDVVGFEALARFAGTPTRPPDAWFAEAAGIGWGLDLDLAALRLALADLARLPPGTHLAVNLSPASAASATLAAVLAPVALERLVVELTEHALVADYDHLATALRPLRERGLRVAVDDAGAGYASFRHILRLRPDLIKLDMSLTRDVDADPARRALATALITFAAETGATIVAEGVETADELRTLRGLGVRLAQGYYLGRPAPLAEAAERPPGLGRGGTGGREAEAEPDPIAPRSIQGSPA